LPSGEKFVVAVHNNTDVDDKAASQKSVDLTATAFVRDEQFGGISHNMFAVQAAGVYLANAETDPDNFIFLSSPRHVGFFAENNFNVVVQKSAGQLESSQCAVDDGSLSVYAGRHGIQYICLEADAANGTLRQTQMIAAVYRLLTKTVDEERNPNLVQSISQN
jgi:hypothetical protein